MKIKLSEKQIQTQILQYLRGKAWEVFRMNSGAMRQRDSRGKMYIVRLHDAGTPDIMAFRPLYNNEGGKIGTMTLFVEVKAHPNKPSRLQIIKMQELAEKGAKVLVAYSVDDLIKAGI